MSHDVEAPAGYWLALAKEQGLTVRRPMPEPLEKPLPWTCDACGEPCDLTLVVQPVIHVPDPSHRFRSACCEASVQTTKERHANTP